LLLVPVFNTDATILAQLYGIGIIGGFVFTASYAVWFVLGKTMGIRVGQEEELVGSDMYEGTGNAYPEFMKKKRVIRRA